MFKQALISVSDKSHLLELVKAFPDMHIVSTGGTARFLSESTSCSVQEISHYTGFPELLEGRVKTLHPHVFLSLLARKEVQADLHCLQEEGLVPFDLVVCNLYPFEKVLQEGQKSLHEMLAWIDIGGVSLLRAAAKNFSQVCVLCDPQDYHEVIACKGALREEQRQALAAKAFAHVARYDEMISRRMSLPQDKLKSGGSDVDVQVHQNLSFHGKVFRSLRYGENPHQKAWWCHWKGQSEQSKQSEQNEQSGQNEQSEQSGQVPTEKEEPASLETGIGWQRARQLQGKPLSYNNLLDLDSGLQLLREFETPTALALKHNNPCGVATAPTTGEKNLLPEPLPESGRTLLLKKALSADPKSVFGGVVMINFPLGESGTQHISSLFLECVFAPSFTEGALKILSKKKNLRLLCGDLKKIASYGSGFQSREIRSISGGFLWQERDRVSKPDWEQWTFSEKKPSPALYEDICLAWKLCAHLKSNAIALCYQQQSVGLGMGQVNRVDAVEQALSRMELFHPHISKEQVVMASEAFFPFPDSVEMAARAGLRWIVQPGGSVNDLKVLQRAKELGVEMILTGQRHFRH